MSTQKAQIPTYAESFLFYAAYHVHFASSHSYLPMTAEVGCSYTVVAVEEEVVFRDLNCYSSKDRADSELEAFPYY